MSLSISVDEFNYIRYFLKESAGIFVDEDKSYLIESRLSPLIKNGNMLSFKDLVLKLKYERFGELHQKVVEAMTTNETYFFRDGHPFESFKKIILPELMEKKKTERGINIWSAACSTGQEAYSLSILLNELDYNLVQWDFKIHASDISTQALEKAKKGVYTQLEVNRGLSPDMLDKYFKKIEDKWAVTDRLKKFVNFGHINLARQWPEMPLQDVIFMRHVLIYFDLETRREIFNKIKKIMHPEGYLILGVGETTANIDDSFEVVQIDKTLCYKLKSENIKNIKR